MHRILDDDSDMSQDAPDKSQDAPGEQTSQNVQGAVDSRFDLSKEVIDLREKRKKVTITKLSKHSSKHLRMYEWKLQKKRLMA